MNKAVLRLYFISLFRYIVVASLNALWLALCVVILVFVAGSGAISKNPGVILSIALIPTILIVMIGNLIASFSLTSLINIKSESEIKAEQVTLVKNLLTALKVNRISLLYIIASGLFARLFSSEYIIVFITLSLIATLYAFSSLNIERKVSSG